MIFFGILLREIFLSKKSHRRVLILSTYSRRLPRPPDPLPKPDPPLPENEEAPADDDEDPPPRRLLKKASELMALNAKTLNTNRIFMFLHKSLVYFYRLQSDAFRSKSNVQLNSFQACALKIKSLFQVFFPC